MSQNKSVEEVVEDAVVEEFMWQTKGDQHNICGQYVPAFCDKLEKRLRTLLQQERQTSQEREREIVEEITSKIIGAIHNNSTSLVRNTNGRGYSYAESVYLNLLENEIHTILINTLTNPNKN